VDLVVDHEIGIGERLLKDFEGEELLVHLRDFLLLFDFCVESLLIA
jgi:hypothetical protein